MACWLTLFRDSGSGNITVGYERQANPMERVRKATIKAVSKDGTIIAELPVVQAHAVYYYNDVMSRTFHKDDCGQGFEGTPVTYAVEAGKYRSMESKEAANMMAEAEITALGQAYANRNGNCIAIEYKNRRISQIFARNNCEEGYTGQSWEVIVHAGTYISNISQEDADNQALQYIEENGQTIANENAGCSQSLWYSNAVSETFYSETCEDGYEPQPYVYSLPEGKYESPISQEDADQMALDDITLNGQNHANLYGECHGTFYSVEIKENVQRNNCGGTLIGSFVSYTVPAGHIVSTVSQQDADTRARAYFDSTKQAYANTHGTCMNHYLSAEVSGDFTKNDCGTGYEGETLTYTIPAGEYTSQVSQADADGKAVQALNANGQSYANKNGNCRAVYFNTRQSQSFEKNNCPTGKFGTNVEYVVAAGTKKSYVSVAEANQMAIDDIQANGQNYANTHGECVDYFYNDRVSANFTKNDCEDGFIGDTLEYVIEANTYSSRVSKADANRIANEALQSGGQAYANKNGNCTEDIDRTPNWIATGNTKCASSATGAAGSGCSPFKEESDRNVNSESFEQTRWVAGTHACNTPNWQRTGNDRCYGCSYQVEERDTNSCSNLGTRWVAASGSCESCSPYYEEECNNCVGRRRRCYNCECGNDYCESWASYPSACNTTPSWNYGTPYCDGEQCKRDVTQTNPCSSSQSYTENASGCNPACVCYDTTWTNTGNPYCTDERPSYCEQMQVSNCGRTRLIQSNGCQKTYGSPYCDSSGNCVRDVTMCDNPAISYTEPTTGCTRTTSDPYCSDSGGCVRNVYCNGSFVGTESATGCNTNPIWVYDHCNAMRGTEGIDPPNTCHITCYKRDTNRCSASYNRVELYRSTEVTTSNCTCAGQDCGQP